jgi:enoyl-[acyl-carrier protein] reductase II
MIDSIFQQFGFQAYLSTVKKLTEILGTQYPIIQGGMIWCSGWELASAVSNAGGLGTIGAGSMYPEVLRDQIRKCKAATDRPFAVNLPLIYPQVAEHIQIILEENVPVVITSAGNPKLYAPTFKGAGRVLMHVVSSAKFAKKAEEAGCDAVIAEGFEAGGHNGREETTTLCLIPQVVDAVNIPVVAAGGIADGRSMLAVMTLGAAGVQMGSRFVLTHESSAHINFKQAVLHAQEGDTQLTLKELTPVRLLNSPFADQVKQAYQSHATIEELKTLLGRGRAKKGMFEGDMLEGELEIGQVSARMDKLISAEEVVKQTMREFTDSCKKMSETWK